MPCPPLEPIVEYGPISSPTHGRVLEIVAAVGFETTTKRLSGDTSEWVWVTFTEDGLVSGIDAHTVFLQKVRDANDDPSWSPEIDPRFFPKPRQTTAQVGSRLRGGFSTSRRARVRLVLATSSCQHRVKAGETRHRCTPASKALCLSSRERQPGAMRGEGAFLLRRSCFKCRSLRPCGRMVIQGSPSPNNLSTSRAL